MRDDKSTEQLVHMIGELQDALPAQRRLDLILSQKCFDRHRMARRHDALGIQSLERVELGKQVIEMVRFDKTNKNVASHSVRDRRALWQDLIDGFRYALHRPRVFSLLSISAVNSLFGAPYLTLVPIFARNVVGLYDGVFGA